METVTSSASNTERTAMQRFGDSGMMLLPWTKQILGVLWEHLRLLVQLICYSLMTVFQMFRFEVHLRITDDTGEHIQHMTNGSGDTADSFLSSLFENKNVMVAGQNTLTNPFDLNSHSRSVLSSLVNDELCCSLVDDFVSRATECLSDNDDLYIGEHCSWNHGFDWNLLTGSERSPVPFTACVSSLYQKDIQKHDESCTELYCNFSSSPIEDRRQELGGQSSDSEISWGGSDSSCVEGDKEESDKLWDLLTRSTDPYHPLHFTACVSSGIAGQRRTQRDSRAPQKSCLYTASQTSVLSCPDAGEQRNAGTFSEDDEEALWKSLSLEDDPYHPLNFRAPLHSLAANSAHAHADEPDCHKQSSKVTRDSTAARGTKHRLMSRRAVSHQSPQLAVEKPSKVQWKRTASKTAEFFSKQETPVKKVRFSPVVQIHKMSVWSFALQASRKGPWEEHARDRDRFQRRILEAEQAIGYCFSLAHRKKISAYQQSTLNK